MDAAKIRAALERFGAIKGIEGVDVSASPTIVRFSTHESASAARRAAPELVHICDGVDTLYNERSYDGRKSEKGLEDDDGRGWCARCCSPRPLIPLLRFPHLKQSPPTPPPCLCAMQVLLRGRSEQ